MDNDIIGIDEASFITIIENIKEKKEMITKNLNELENLVDATNNCIGYDMGEILRNKFNVLAQSFPNIIENLNTIILELNFCKNNYKNQDKRAAILFNDAND